MSHEIFRKIKLLENGDFLVTSKSSNCGGPPKEWVMDYFRKKYPNFTNDQRKAVFVLHGLYYGDKYYPESYKKLKALAIEYSKKLYDKTGRYPYNYIVDTLSPEAYEKETAKILREGGTVKYSSYEEYYKAAEEEVLLVVNGFLNYMKSKKA